MGLISFITTLIGVGWLVWKFCSVWWLTHIIAAIIAAVVTRRFLQDNDKVTWGAISKLGKSGKTWLYLFAGLVVVYFLSKFLGWLLCYDWWLETHLAVAALSAVGTYIFSRRNAEGTVAYTCAKHIKAASLFCASCIKTKCSKVDAGKFIKQARSTTISGLTHAKDKLTNLKPSNWRGKRKSDADKNDSTDNETKNDQ